MVIFSIKLATVCLVLSIASGKDIRPFLREDYLVPTGWRPDRPYFQDGLPSVEGTDMSLHHVVPYSTLRRFYNAVLQRGIKQEVNNLGTGLKDVLHNLNNAKIRGSQFEMNALENVSITPNAIDFCDMLVNYKYTTDPNLWPEPKRNNLNDGFEQTIDFITWLPGNLFVGPTSRSDDPRNAFEEESCQLIGDDQFKLLKSVSDLMNSFVREITGPANSRVVSEVATKLKTITDHRPIIYEYDATKWVKNKQGLFSIIGKNGKRRCARA